jgi:hypothetical protein
MHVLDIFKKISLNIWEKGSLLGISEAAVNKVLNNLVLYYVKLHLEVY